MFEKEEQKEKELIEFLTNNGVKIAPLGNGDVAFFKRWANNCYFCRLG